MGQIDFSSRDHLQAKPGAAPRPSVAKLKRSPDTGAQRESVSSYDEVEVHIGSAIRSSRDGGNPPSIGSIPGNSDVGALETESVAVGYDDGPLHVVGTRAPRVIAFTATFERKGLAPDRQSSPRSAMGCSNRHASKTFGAVAGDFPPPRGMGSTPPRELSRSAPTGLHLPGSRSRIALDRNPGSGSDPGAAARSHPRTRRGPIPDRPGAATETHSEEGAVPRPPPTRHRDRGRTRAKLASGPGRKPMRQCPASSPAASKKSQNHDSFHDASSGS